MNLFGYQITKQKPALQVPPTSAFAMRTRHNQIQAAGVPTRSVGDFSGPTFNGWGYPAQGDIFNRTILSDPRDAYILALPWKLTPQQVLTILRQALGGDLWSSAQLNYLMLTTWPLYRMAAHQLREAVAYSKFRVNPCAVEGEEPSEVAKQKAALVERAIKSFSPNQFADESGFSGLCYHLLDAMLQGLAVCEIMWQEVRSPKFGLEVLPRATAWVHPKHYTFTNEGTLTIFGQDMSVIFDQYQFKAKGKQPLNRSQPTDAPLPNPDKFLCAQFLSRSGSVLGAGFMAPLAWYWAARMWGNEWMLQSAKKYGSPFLTLSYRPGMSDAEDRRKLEAFAKQASSDRYLLHPEGSLATVHPASSLGPDNPQRHIVEESDRMCLYLLLGQSSTTQAVPGSLGEQDTKQNVKQERVQALAEWLARNPLRHFARAVLRQNYGEDSECPEIYADYTKPLNAPEVGGLAMALSSSGVPVLASELYQKIGFTKPGVGDTICVRGQIGEMGEQAQPQDPNMPEGQEGQEQEPVDEAGEPTQAKVALDVSTIKARLRGMTVPEINRVELLVSKAEKAKELNGEWTELERILR